MIDSLSFAALRLKLVQSESDLVKDIMLCYPLDAVAQRQVYLHAFKLANNTRQKLQDKGGFDAFLASYDLSSQEGVLLMCLAEAFLRIPDNQTADALIRDTLGSANWSEHLGDGASLFVNATTWALLLTGRMLHWEESRENLLKRLVARSGEPVIRKAVGTAMRLMGSQFVLGQTIEEAIRRSSKDAGIRYSYDMLGEAARTRKDAQAYFDAYAHAIRSLGNAINGNLPANLAHSPSISIKLSALHPRYEYAKSDQLLKELLPNIISLAEQAKELGVGFTIDAEEAARLELSLEIFAGLAKADTLSGWNGLGLVVQAYQKRGLAVLDWVIKLAQTTRRVFPLRLVKGAYWDSEIKLAQEQGLGYYPVFTRKPATDLHYLVCAEKMLSNNQFIYPCFATHNAYTIAAVDHIASAIGVGDYEFQRLHGMGEDLYNERGKNNDGHACRIYAPVGDHQRLLGYLMRRLLENGANSSFVNALADEKKNLSSLLIDPSSYIQRVGSIPHPKIPLPTDIFSNRKNSFGLDLSHRPDIAAIESIYDDFAAIKAHPLPVTKNKNSKPQECTSPAARSEVIGSVAWATSAQVKAAIENACAISSQWNAVAVAKRAEVLRDIAKALEQNLAELIVLIAREGGRTQADGLSEVREAVDFCRYYANQAESLFAPISMEGVSGETNLLQLHGRGVFVCISPWNFPVAIFTGQIVAALVSGNCVIAKPAEQTTLCAFRVISLIHRVLDDAGLSQQLVQFVPGDGKVGAELTGDKRIAGVAFTGSTATAKAIQQSLSTHPSIPVLIAETGGLNALIADSSALAEQLVGDVVVSGFNSAGQRCSALRLLCVQDELADSLSEMIAGALEELQLGSPHLLATDIGPVIDQGALSMLERHRVWLDKNAKCIGAARLDPKLKKSGNYFAPCAYEIDSLDAIEHEVFGPIVHLLRWKSGELDKLIDGINAKNYGLTFGIHTRINARAEYITKRIRAGNIYINRNIVGAVVGCQPFGGMGLSGTGPKAGGPHYLHRFSTEVAISTDTTATGGNASLLAMQDELLDEKCK